MKDLKKKKVHFVIITHPTVIYTKTTLPAAYLYCVLEAYTYVHLQMI